jgi:uncharacterized protein (TIGR02145 family)
VFDGRKIAITGKDFTTAYIPDSSTATFKLQADADLIADDADNLWFTGGVQKSVSLQNLINRDYTKTIIKFNHSSPYQVSAIGILKSGVTLTPAQVDKLHSDFELWLFWSGVFNDYGYLKDNRPLDSNNFLYGNLYNWFAVTDSRNIANTGWHVPTKTELETLVTSAGGSAVAGGKLKETGFSFWQSPNTGATNDFGFNGRGAGERNHDTGVYYSILLSLDLWSSTDTGGSPYVLQFNHDLVDSFVFATYPNAGLSVRLIKDSTTLSPGETGTYIGNDGTEYQTICIGGQELLSENLAETKYRNGDLVPEITDNTAWKNLTTGALCAYGNDHNNI